MWPFLSPMSCLLLSPVIRGGLASNFPLPHVSHIFISYLGCRNWQNAPGWNIQASHSEWGCLRWGLAEVYLSCWEPGMFGFQSSSVCGPLKKRTQMQLINLVVMMGSSLETLIRTDMSCLSQSTSAFPVPGSTVSVLRVFSCCDTHLLEGRTCREIWSHCDETRHFHYNIPRLATSESPPGKTACHANADTRELQELFPNQSQERFQLPTSGTELLALHRPRSRSSSHSHHLYSELPGHCTLIKEVLHQQIVIQIQAHFLI